MKNQTLVNQFSEYNIKNRLFTPGDRIIIALSGGIDSVVLFELFYYIQKEYDITLHAAHFNHQLRGEESETDETFVKKICKDKKIPLVIERCDVGSYCKKNKLSIETGARECRYAFFRKTAKQLNFQYVATAHNANDNAETILDHIIRGTGVRGLCGISAKRDIFIRPLLFARREEIESYASENNIAYRTDSTNKDTAYKRNRIRHVLMPLLNEQFNPSVIDAINRLGANMSELNEYLNFETSKAFNNCLKFKDKQKIILDIEDFLAYFIVLQKRILLYSLDLFGIDPRLPDFDFYQKILQVLHKKQSGKILRITNRLCVTADRNHLVIWQEPQDLKPVTLKINPGEYPFWDKYIFEIKTHKKRLEFQDKDKDTEWIDADKLVEPLQIRAVKPGDRFYPVNFDGSKKVSDFFIDEKIPVYERHVFPILTCKTGIIWICGKRLDDRFKITDKTKNVLKIHLRKVE